jgi:hypothetical protein
MLKFDASIFGGELPVGLGVVGIAVVLPGGDFVDEDLFVGNTAIEALRRSDALAPGLIWGATDRTLQRSPCSCEEAIASDDEDHEVTDCDHLKRLSVSNVEEATND